VEKAYQRGADCDPPDLETRFSGGERKRPAIGQGFARAGRQGRGGSGVRIKQRSLHVSQRFGASSIPAWTALPCPRPNRRKEMRNLESVIGKAGERRGMKPGHVQICHFVEPRRAAESPGDRTASPRIESMFIGPEDYCLELGVEPRRTGRRFFTLSYIVSSANRSGSVPWAGGSIAGFRDLEAFERSVSRARQIGCEGASCIHPIRWW